MAEVAITAVEHLIWAMVNEARQAKDNSKALVRLSETAETVRPILEHIRKMNAAKKNYMVPALAELRIALSSAKDLVVKRGAAPSIFSWPLRALTNYGKKVEAEILGSEESIKRAMSFVNTALVAAAATGIENIEAAVALLDANIMRFEAEAATTSAAPDKPWCLSRDKLKYCSTRGRPITLGFGGFGVVFKATYDGVEVAVKEPARPELMREDAKMRESFCREADIMFKLHHKNVVAFAGAIAEDGEDEDGEVLYALVSEVLVRTLDDHVRLAGARLSEADLRALCAGIAEGVAYLHSMAIVHRDIKPRNVMVDAAGTAKLIDFGLSKQKTALRAATTTTMAGTPDWLSPEKQRGEPSTAASDVFSLGLVLLAVLLRSLNAPPQPPSSSRRLVDSMGSNRPAGLVALSCTEPLPRRRPASFTVALALLSDLAAAGAAGPTPAEHSAAEAEAKARAEAKAKRKVTHALVFVFFLRFVVLSLTAPSLFRPVLSPPAPPSLRSPSLSSGPSSPRSRGCHTHRRPEPQISERQDSPRTSRRGREIRRSGAPAGCPRRSKRKRQAVRDYPCDVRQLEGSPPHRLDAAA